jgi:LacI family transcriptional regulator
VRVQNHKIAAAVEATGLPAVDVLGVVARTKLPLVHVDDQLIAHLAAEHLLERGFHHFGFFGIQKENWAERRRDCFQQFLAAAGAQCAVYEISRQVMAAAPWEEQMDALAVWLGGLAKPVGVMVCSDQVGPHVLEACRRAGIPVPDDVAVLGVDNDETLCEICTPPLSSINAGHQRVGFEAAAMLDRLMRRKVQLGHPIFVKPQGVVSRRSTDVLAMSDRHVAGALKIIREQACSGLTAAQVFARVPVSRSVLQRRFRRETGRSIQDEIVHAKVKRARQLLAETDLPLVEIAELSGFKHQEYLGVVFKAKTGKSPARYRREAAFG